MKFCETHKDGRIASTTMCYQRYWDRAWDIMDEKYDRVKAERDSEKVDVCVITEWVEKSKEASAIGKEDCVFVEMVDLNVERCDATIRYDRPGVHMAEHVCGLPAGHWELGHQCYVRGCDAEWSRELDLPSSRNRLR